MSFFILCADSSGAKINKNQQERKDFIDDDFIRIRTFPFIISNSFLFRPAVVFPHLLYTVKQTVANEALWIAALHCVRPSHLHHGKKDYNPRVRSVASAGIDYPIPAAAR